MSIQKKSLISTLKTAKKANLAGEVKSEKIASMRQVSGKATATAKAQFKTLKAYTLKSAKTASTRVL